MALVFAVMHLYHILNFVTASVHSFFILKKKSGIDKSTEWSTVPACPSLVCFFNRGDSEGTNSPKFLCLCVCFV